MLHRCTNVLHAIGGVLALGPTDLDVIRLEQEHQIAWGRAVHQTTVLEQHREHPCMVQVSMGEHHGIQFVERERLGCGEVGHRVGIAGDVDTHIDHDAALVRGHQMARSSTSL